MRMSLNQQSAVNGTSIEGSKTRQQLDNWQLEGRPSFLFDSYEKHGRSKSDLPTVQEKERDAMIRVEHDETEQEALTDSVFVFAACRSPSFPPSSFIDSPIPLLRMGKMA